MTPAVAAVAPAAALAQAWALAPVWARALAQVSAPVLWV